MNPCRLGSRRIHLLAVVALMVVTLAGCKKSVGPTTIFVEDAVRHYYPVVQGDKIYISYTLRNDGAEPFVIMDIQSTSICTPRRDYRGLVIRQNNELDLHFIYNASKNIGYVKNTIRIYGNVKPKGFVALTFDTNIVPHSININDFEEENESYRRTHDKIEGDYYQRSYYVDGEED